MKYKTIAISIFTINKIFLLSLFFSIVLLHSACQEEDTEKELEGIPVAQVGENYLYKEEITELLPPNYSKEDSTNIVKRYVNNWIERRLLLKEAESKSGIDQKELQERLEDYKYQLLVHAYKQNYVNEYLDTLVTDPQISDYYEKNKANFELKQPIVKAYFVKVKLNTPSSQLDDLRKWMRSDLEQNSEETEKLKSYSYGFAASYFLQDDKWLPMSELVANTPFDRNLLLQKGKFAESEDKEYYYFLKINDFKIQDQVAPLEYVRSQIISVILNKRKVELQEELENEVMERANENQDYKIFTE
ncbi:peptidyl-prolyl cis-trans isomerase [Bernardetia sp.]|uniref:peptidyl-prolyl cis-trans isomerase n=1 Tax=Bernardetia sp. TaxID=1937974 RepID=UPI0025C5A41B|nr:peptidyl-prolyl cis-trans isomerase [Bernardetia sp.]